MATAHAVGLRGRAAGTGHSAGDGVLPTGESLEVLFGEGFGWLVEFREGDRKAGRAGNGDRINAGLAELFLEGGILTDGGEELGEFVLAHGKEGRGGRDLYGKRGE